MTVMLSLVLLCQKRTSLSLAVLGLSLPCSVPATRALHAFQRICHAHSNGWKEPPTRSPLFPCWDKPLG